MIALTSSVFDVGGRRDPVAAAAKYLATALEVTAADLGRAFAWPAADADTALAALVSRGEAVESARATGRSPLGDLTSSVQLGPGEHFDQRVLTGLAGQRAAESTSDVDANVAVAIAVQIGERRFGDEQARAELLVRLLDAAGEVDRVADRGHRRRAASHRADDRRAGVHAHVELERPAVSSLRTGRRASDSATIARPAARRVDWASDAGQDGTVPSARHP